MINKIMLPMVIIASLFCSCSTNIKDAGKISLPQSCGYNLPDGYKLVYSESLSKYAIETNQYHFKTYLQDFGSAGIDVGLLVIHPYGEYDDSCSAKDLCKRYIQQQSLGNDFK